MPLDKARRNDGGWLEEVAARWASRPRLRPEGSAPRDRAIRWPCRLGASRVYCFMTCCASWYRWDCTYTVASAWLRLRSPLLASSAEPSVSAALSKKPEREYAKAKSRVRPTSRGAPSSRSMAPSNCPSSMRALASQSSASAEEGSMRSAASQASSASARRPDSLRTTPSSRRGSSALPSS